VKRYGYVLTNENVGAKRFYAALSAHSNFALHASLTESLVDRLVKWLIVFHQLDKVNTVLAQGRTAFSYWVAANIPTDMETRLELLDEPCTDRRLANECAIIKRVCQFVEDEEQEMGKC
ncbi:hypothetical protein Tcan_03238, partial [Toxocara canis]